MENIGDKDCALPVVKPNQGTVGDTVGNEDWYDSMENVGDNISELDKSDGASPVAKPIQKTVGDSVCNVLFKRKWLLAGAFNTDCNC